MDHAASRTESFAALGTQIDLVARPAAPEALHLARTVMHDIDEGCSRFRSDSDLAQVNARPGQWTQVGPVLVAALQVALEAAAETEGLVSPCLGRSLRSVGYDADLNIVRERGDAPAAAQPVPHPHAWRDIEIDPSGAVRIPSGIELDLGATGKAFAADLAALTIHEHLGVDIAVSAGGDVRIVNRTGDPWPVEIAERPEDTIAETVSMIDGGIATSSTTRRRWTQGGVARHHLIDPRTGLPSIGPWRTVTASGPTCVAANVAATAAIILGEAATDWLRQRGVWARLVDEQGAVLVLEAAVESAR